MNSKSYQSLLRYAKYKVLNKQTAEDLLHDSIVTALEKKQQSSAFVARTFDNHRRTYIRNLEIEQRNHAYYYHDEFLIDSPSNYGEALDMIKAINVITNYIKTSPKFNYRDKSKRSIAIFIDYYLWKKDSEVLAKKYKSTVKSIRNLSYGIAARVRAIKSLLPYINFIDEQNYNPSKQSSSRRNLTQRIYKAKLRKCV